LDNFQERPHKKDACGHKLPQASFFLSKNSYF